MMTPYSAVALFVARLRGVPDRVCDLRPRYEWRDVQTYVSLSNGERVQLESADRVGTS